MRADRYEASLDEAKEYPQLWRLGLGLAFVIFMYVSLIIPITVATVVLRARMIAHPDGPTAFHLMSALQSLQADMLGAQGANTPGIVFFLLVTFVGLFVGPILAAAAFHFRGPGSLFGDLDEWLEGFLTALAVLVPIYGLMMAIGFVLEEPVPGLAFDRWLRLLPIAIPLIFMQTAAEELLFRGYLQQQLAARFAARWLWMGIPAVLFAALHWNPAAGANLPLILMSALVFGLLAADLAEQTGNLGASMGLHFGNNVSGMLGVAVADTITGLALYVSPASVSETGTQSLSIGLSILILVLVWWITRRRLVR